MNIQDLYRSKKYKEIIESLPNVEMLGENDLFYLSYSHYHLKNYKQAIQIGEFCKKKYPDKTRINSPIAWSIYKGILQPYFQGKNNDEENAKLYLDYIVEISEQDKYSPYVISIFNFINRHYKSNKIDYKLVNDYLSLIDPGKLSSEGGKYKDKKFASDREKWFLNKSKALVELGQYKECIEITNMALSKSSPYYIEDYYYNGNIWMFYRQAISYYNLKDFDKAKALFKTCLENLDHWIFNRGLYETEKAKNNIEMALKYASLAALSRDPHRLKVSLYQDMGDFLFELGKKEEALHHYKLVNSIRQKNKWSPNSKNSRLLSSSPIDKISYKENLNYLKDFWLENRLNGEKFYQGRINNFIGDGGAGFIHYDNGKSIYFNRAGVRAEKLEEGDKVEFIIVDSFDRKKNQKSKAASEIRLVKKG